MAINVKGKKIILTGDKALIRKLQDINRRHPAIIDAALFKTANDIMKDSKENFVPVDTTNLQASGHTELPERKGNKVTVTIGYGGAAAPYALAVHENPRSGKTQGTGPSGQKYKTWAQVGEWKYLETPLIEATFEYQENLVKNVNEFLRRQGIQ